LQVHREVPFAFRDHFELWLLDPDDQPLALLHSVLTETDTETRPPMDWRAGIAASEQFRSSAVGTLHESPGAYLTRYVNACSNRNAQWFVRTDDGAGLGLRVMHGSDSLRGRVLDAEAFPALYIATGGMDAAHARLVADYHAWQAPWLLMLTHLDDATRAAMEAHAHVNADSMEKHHRLYPKVLDRVRLQAARVEAAFMRNQPQRSSANPALSADYIELNRGPGD
jgi:hypothetical protein